LRTVAANFLDRFENVTCFKEFLLVTRIDERREGRRFEVFSAPRRLTHAASRSPDREP